MPHEVYDINCPTPIYRDQSGEGGSGFFEGMRFQRGYGFPTRGLGQRGGGVLGVLQKAWKYLGPLARKYVAPLAKDALKALSDEGLDAGQKILSDISHGIPIKEAMVETGTKAAKNLAKKAGARISQMGTGAKRGVTHRKRRSLSNVHLVGKSVLESAAKRRRRGDTFGLY